MSSGSTRTGQLIPSSGCSELVHEFLGDGGIFRDGELMLTGGGRRANGDRWDWPACGESQRIGRG